MREQNKKQAVALSRAQGAGATSRRFKDGAAAHNTRHTRFAARVAETIAGLSLEYATYEQTKQNKYLQKRHRKTAAVFGGGGGVPPSPCSATAFYLHLAVATVSHLSSPLFFLSSRV